MKIAAFMLLALSASTATLIEAKKPPRGRWQIMRSTDPITGRSTCIVAAMDMAGGLTFSRIGALYPMVENDSELGLLVGVSSGGKVRLPTGDILWRVDDRPFRTLKAADNPPAQTKVDSPDVSTKAVQEVMALSAQLTATSTLASGDKAREMLAEMLSGTGLVYRSAAAMSYGLPGAAGTQIGQITKDGLKPFPLDESFRTGVRICGLNQVGPN